jgi:hypothetical protein
MKRNFIYTNVREKQFFLGFLFFSFLIKSYTHTHQLIGIIIIHKKTEAKVIIHNRKYDSLYANTFPILCLGVGGVIGASKNKYTIPTT